MAVDGLAFGERRVDAVAGGIDAVDRAAGLALKLGVELGFKAFAAEGAFHLEGGEVGAGEVVGGLDVVVASDVADGLGGDGAERIGTDAGGVNLEG